MKKVEEMRYVPDLCEADLIVSLPMLFSGVAYLWYDSYKSTCHTWAEFCSEANDAGDRESIFKSATESKRSSGISRTTNQCAFT